MMNIKKQLLNPFVLTVQGFAIGATLMLATARPDDEVVAADPAPAQSTSIIRSVGA